jgi:non-specific serine/threonine protein kinase/serine/threonine-protein kinase
VFSEENPETLKAVNNIAAFLWSQEKYAEAEPYAREAMEKRRHVLGEQHPDTLVSISNVGGLLRDQGRLSEAAPYYREALEKSRRVLGDDHANTLIFTTAMGGVLVAQGNWQDAESLLAPAEARVRKVFRGGNAYRLAALLSSLGTARGSLARDSAGFAAAEANLLEAHAIYSKVPGPSQKSSQACLRAIADFYAQWDRVEPGKGFDTKAAEWKAKLEDPPTTPKSPG